MCIRDRHHEDFCDVMAEAAIDHLLNTVLSDDLFIPNGGFSPTKEEVDNMNRAKETADKAAKMLDTCLLYTSRCV